MDPRRPDDRGRGERRLREPAGYERDRPEPRRREPERPEPGRRERAATGRRGPGAEKTARLAADYVAKMTGKEPEEIVSVEQADDGGWLIGVEVVETRRVPDSTDILAVYEAELDAEGELVAYRRVKRYSRCQVGER
jgi:phenylpyruvate tautomerase PptA (4-oxalocrotonate tautomerase family)